MEKYKLYQGDCLEVMKNIEDGSVDLILTDPPYGTTACKWDSVIPFEPMWEQLNRIIKPNGAIVLFGTEPFSSALRMSNIENYKYDWVWVKQKPSNFQLMNYQCGKVHENIIVFSNAKACYTKNGNKMCYYPQKTPRESIRNANAKIYGDYDKNILNSYKNGTKDNFKQYKDKHPVSLLYYNTEPKKVHPAQKPVALLEYLIKTYTLEGETVLDFTMGSGSTGVACLNTNRNFIGIELNEGYFEIAQNRVEEAANKTK